MNENNLQTQETFRKLNNDIKKNNINNYKQNISLTG